MKPIKPKFKPRHSKAETDWFKSISAGIRKVHDKAVFKPLAGIESDMPCKRY